MLPKARIIAALEHREADRVPIRETGAAWDIVERALGRPTYYRSKWKEWVAEWEGRRDEVVKSYQRDLVFIREMAQVCEANGARLVLFTSPSPYRLAVGDQLLLTRLQSDLQPEFPSVGYLDMNELADDIAVRDHEVLAAVYSEIRVALRVEESLGVIPGLQGPPAERVEPIGVGERAIHIPPFGEVLHRGEVDVDVREPVLLPNRDLARDRLVGPEHPAVDADLLGLAPVRFPRGARPGEVEDVRRLVALLREERHRGHVAGVGRGRGVGVTRGPAVAVAVTVAVGVAVGV